MRGNVLLSEVYVKVNCRPSLFDVDLLHEIDPEHERTRCRIGGDRISLDLRKRATGTKAELRERREQALKAAEEREQARVKKKDEWRQNMVQAGEHVQWRLDRENREQIETWEKEEKDKWEAEVLGSFDDETGDLLAEAAPGPPAGDL